MTRLVSSKWLGERGERLPCFPSWGISETKCTCNFSRHNLGFVVLCSTMYPLYCGSIDQGLDLSLQKKRIRIARNSEKGMYSVWCLFTS